MKTKENTLDKDSTIRTSSCTVEENYEIYKSMDHPPRYMNPTNDYQRSRTPRNNYEMSRHPVIYYYDEWCDYFEDCHMGYEDHLAEMTDKELALYHSLPNRIRVYRGIAVRSKDDVLDDYGFSWTLDKKVAEFFANEFARRTNKSLIPIILEREIFKKDIIWILLERDEKEVVVYRN